MYSNLPNLIIGFHGCDISTFEDVLYHHLPLKPSRNPYDWLGNGIYFWENSLDRAKDWAKHHHKIKTPCAIGAVIDMGRCLNLTDYHSADVLKLGYEMLTLQCNLSGSTLPINRDAAGNRDLLIRDLDCAVMERIHQYNKDTRNQEYDSVRGVFVEGAEVYPNSGFREKTHIQLCVRNPNCIKGYFNPMEPNGAYRIP